MTKVLKMAKSSSECVFESWPLHFYLVPFDKALNHCCFPAPRS